MTISQYAESVPERSLDPQAEPGASDAHGSHVGGDHAGPDLGNWASARAPGPRPDAPDCTSRAPGFRGGVDAAARALGTPPC